jgi:predicted HD phosphohydrolase
MSHLQLRIVENNVNSIKKLFSIYGEADYIGESITQLDHAIQAGILALNEKRPSNIVISAFLHDIGHLVGLSQPSTIEMVDSTGLLHLGIQKHEELGATFLSSLGFPDSITIPIKNHVLAKRYLLSIDNMYKSQVSSASMKTFELQGGILSVEEITEFEQSPYFEESIQVRMYDDLAKENVSQSKEMKQVYLSRLFDIISQTLLTL